MKNFIPHEYQRNAIDFVKENNKCALWLPMGAGKTSCTLSMIVHHLDMLTDDTNKKITLVVAPLLVVYLTWRNEVNKFKEFEHLKVDILHGKDKEQTYLNSNADILLINYEGLEWLRNYVLKTKTLRFNSIFFDESSKLKSWSSRRFKVSKQICSWIDRVVLLSATPSPKSLLDLWSQYALLDKGARLEKGITKFKDKYFNQRKYGFGFDLKDGAEEKILALVADITFRIDNSQLPPVPELTVNKIELEFDKKTYKEYKDFEKTMFYELSNVLDDGVEALSLASLTSKCRQFTQGYLYHTQDDSKDREIINIHKTKLDFLLELLESLNGEKVIIAYHFKEDYRVLTQALSKLYIVECLDSKTSKEELKEKELAWNNKNIDILLCNPASASYGLNLQQGGNNIIWYGMTYNWEHYTQLIGRLHRQGQENIVRNHIIMIKNTIDEAVFDNLMTKETGQNSFLNSLYKYQKQTISK